jgi:hypothetical protein
MKVFYLLSTEAELHRFETLRKAIRLKKSNDEIKSMIEILLDAIQDVNKIRKLSANRRYFNARHSSWHMHYRIASKILKKEIESPDLNYRFELTYYVLHYLMLPNELKRSFFLMHGLPLVIDYPAEEFYKELRGKEYTIYKGEEEFVSPFLISGNQTTPGLREIFKKNSIGPLLNENRLILQLYD